MKSEHRTHLLFIEPKGKPSVKPIEDAITKKVDAIFKTLKKSDSGYRGSHHNPFGDSSDCSDYAHPKFDIVSNSLAPYYIRHFRSEISKKQLDWISELYEIMKNPSAYYCKLTIKPTLLLKIYECDKEYGTARTYGLRIEGATRKGVLDLLDSCFYKEVSESDFGKFHAASVNTFDHTVSGCKSVRVYDIIKK